MKNLTTPKAILFGLGLIALAIASVPYSSQIIKPAFASFHEQEKIIKVMLCGENLFKGISCAKINDNRIYTYTKIQD